MKTLLFILTGSLLLTTGGLLIAADAPAPPLSPMMAEITANVDAVRSQVAELTMRYHEAADEESALALMREISRVKRESRIEMLRIQLRYARQDGRHETVATLEAAIAKMTAPPRRGEPVPRSAPSRDGRP